MKQQPFTVLTSLADETLAAFDNHIVRCLSAMQGQYRDEQAYKTMLAQHDPSIYEVYEIKRPEVEGDLMSGISIVHPGKVGDEYYMTKGHFHAVLDTAEIYYVLKGQGAMVMETPEGEAAVEELRPGQVLYVPPRWAHRSVNTAEQGDLATFFVYPAHAGHDYGTIEQQGFRKLVIERDGRPQVIENPRWRARER